jgi:Cys-tRNA(Pro)/Cys-tRNA(Cys) deacylase
MASQGTRAIDLLRRERVAHAVHAYEPAQRSGRERTERPNYGIEAAEALGVEPARVYKTLVAGVEGRLVLAVVPVTGELDLKRLADTVGSRSAALADPAEAERATGYVIGGISPLGSRRRLAAVLDASMQAHETILVSAGRRGLQVELAPADLARLLDARFAPLVRTIGRNDLVHPPE